MPIYSLIQTVGEAAREPDLKSAVLFAAGLIVVGVMGWVVKVTRDASKTITRLTDYLFGFSGQNGLSSDVKALREDVNRLLLRRDRREGPPDRRHADSSETEE